jgi:hypothetical protein
MGVRFRGTAITTSTKTEFTVELWDTTYSSTGVTNLTLFGEGFEITYEGQGDEIYTPIKGSSCSVYVGITNDANGTALQTWINNSVLATKEDLYHVAIYEGSDLLWFGVILPSLGNQPDASKPYDFVIQATDGLARLKDSEFTLAKNSAINLPSPNYTFTDLIYELLKSTPLYLATNQSILFSTCVGYYENNMPTKAGDIDPLDYSEINAATFTSLEDNGEVIGDSIYDALAKICESWGMRVMLSGGIYRFYQVQSYSDDGVTRYERFYSRATGAYVLNDTFTGYNENLRPDTETRIPRPIAGNQWSYYDPLKYVFLKVPFDEKANMLDELDLMPIYAPTGLYTYRTDLRNSILGGTSKKLNFATSINLTTPLIAVKYEVTIKITLKLGSNWLKKDVNSGNVSWETTSSSYYILLSGVNSGSTYVDIALQTPEIPSGTHSSNFFSIEIFEVLRPAFWRPAGSPPVPTFSPPIVLSPSAYFASRVIKSTFLRYNSSSDNIDEVYFEYIAGNTATPVNSYDIELPDTNICEAFDISNPGNLFINTGSSLVPSDGLWRVEDTGGTYDFPMIRVRDVLTSQIYATAKYQGGILGAMIYGHSSFDYSNKRYILNGGVFSAQSETWDGEWIEIGYTRASFEEIQGATNQAGSGGEGQLRREIGDLTNRDNIGNLFTASFITQQQISNITTGVNGTITTLPVGLFEDEVREGDYLRLMTPEGGGNYVVRASADSTGTNVSIDSFTTTGNIPENTYVMFDLADIFNRVRLGNIKVKRFTTNVTLEPFTQIALGAVDEIDITLPDITEAFVNNRSIEITVKNICSGSSDIINLKGGGADIETTGETIVVIQQGHALTVFNDGEMWLIKSSFKHE